MFCGQLYEGSDGEVKKNSLGYPFIGRERRLITEYILKEA
jgi:hypothetical protein